MSSKKIEKFTNSDLESTNKKKIRVNLIFLDENKYLYDKTTKCAYKCTPPHTKVGVIEFDTELDTYFLKKV